ncbi:hypothetical protein [Xanthomonas fragariae]|uniref:antitoxin VbhA family protein n=1 Tax=Xanthomonas fragariae TaxID=48664 RepID=UPI0022AB4A47|nr:hypothetical protein [Xanthomonas fragariae]WAT16207.1 hypothetical protein OZ429_08025 [Xanthomonas fragariae]
MDPNMQRLEGLEPDPQTIAELERAAGGEIEIADVLERLRERVAAGEFRSVPAGGSADIRVKMARRILSSFVKT